MCLIRKKMYKGIQQEQSSLTLERSILYFRVHQKINLAVFSFSEFPIQKYLTKKTDMLFTKEKKNKEKIKDNKKCQNQKRIKKYKNPKLFLPSL